MLVYWYEPKPKHGTRIDPNISSAHKFHATFDPACLVHRNAHVSLLGGERGNAFSESGGVFLWKLFDEDSLQPPLPDPVQSQTLEFRVHPDKFVPSPALTAFVRDALLHMSVEGDIETEAQALIRNAVLRLFNTMAGSVKAQGRAPPYPLSENHKFANPVAKAILARLPIGVYEQGAFLNQLEKEVSAATDDGLIQGPFWRVVRTSDGTMEMRIQPKDEGRGAPDLEGYVPGVVVQPF
jgi:hypothetical protein